MICLITSDVIKKNKLVFDKSHIASPRGYKVFGIGPSDGKWCHSAYVGIRMERRSQRVVRGPSSDKSTSLNEDLVLSLDLDHYT